MKLLPLCAILILGSVVSTDATAEAEVPPVGQSQQQLNQQARQQERQQLLQRVYQMRMRFEQERAVAENNARATVRLITDGNRGLTSGVDSPTVTGLRQQTNQQLARFESQFQCLDVEVEANSGNTVVICGDNTGDISGTNVSAERDIVTINGGTP